MTMYLQERKDIQGFRVKLLWWWAGAILIVDQSKQLSCLAEKDAVYIKGVWNSSSFFRPYAT
jgi:hypothetical protein